jgi:hypothetical protein
MAEFQKIGDHKGANWGSRLLGEYSLSPCAPDPRFLCVTLTLIDRDFLP